MKTINVAGIALIIWMLLALFLGFNSYKKGEKNIHLENKIDSLENMFSRHTITVGDTTLQIIRDLKIQNETNQALDIRTIYPGINSYYVQLNSRTGMKIIVMKY